MPWFGDAGGSATEMEEDSGRLDVCATRTRPRMGTGRQTGGRAGASRGSNADANIAAVHDANRTDGLRTRNSFRSPAVVMATAVERRAHQPRNERKIMSSSPSVMR